MKTFSQPLTAKEEAVYLERLGTGSEEERKEAKEILVEHNLRLVAHIAKKYQNVDEDMEDLISIGTIGLIKAIDSFDAGKGKLSTYASRCIDNELLMLLRAKKKTSREVSLYDPIGTDREGNEINLLDIIEQEQVDVIDRMEVEERLGRLSGLIRERLSERERAIIMLRYGLSSEHEITQREIGRRLGISRSYVSRIEKKALEKLKEGCRIASDAAIKAKGVISASSSLSDAATKAKIIIDPIKAAAAGMTPQMASGAIYSMMSGSNAMDVMIDGKEYTVTVEFPADEYETVNDIYGITLTNTSGVSVPLSDIGEIVYTDSPQTIVRKDGMYQGTVTATLEADAKFSAQETIRQQMAETFLPEGVEQVTNTMNEMMMEEFTSLITAIITAILLVYIVMAIQFENLRYSGMVMFCIPFSLIGSILLLLITRCTVSMVSLMGFLMLVGIVVNNGILYVDYTNMLRKTMSTEEALVETGKSRLRPILMTTLTTILSMIPMAVGVGKNGQMTQGMAVVIVGGLTASTILTLILLPTFYMIIHKRSKAKKAKKKARREGKELTV